MKAKTGVDRRLKSFEASNGDLSAAVGSMVLKTLATLQPGYQFAGN
jgi:hypothetical protein